MSTRDGPVARSLRMADEDEARLRSDLGRARRGAGISRVAVGRASGISRSTLQRIEAGTRATTLREYAAIGAAVGLDVRLRAFPAGDPIRDAGQQRLLERLRARLEPGLHWRTEVPLPIDGDRRAWDAVISGRGWHIAVEAETVIDDVQALERRLALKRRDGGIGHVILLTAETRRNRRAVAAAPGAFHDFDRDARHILRALARGTDPGKSALLYL